MLSRFDDYPIHQTSEPIAHPATSDRNAYDRYWFNGYAGDGEFYFGIGAALYPNLGVMDCGFSIVRDGVQHAFHASRRAPKEPSRIEVGPFRIEILEPMKRLRVTLDENETGIACDLEFIPRTANVQEGHQRAMRAGRVMMDATRFDQFGHWKGEIRYDGRSLAIDPRRVYATKDRSWGVRPVGLPDAGVAPTFEMPQFFFLWAPIQWRNRCTLASVFEDGDGRRWHWDGAVLPAYDTVDLIPGVEDPAARRLIGVDHDIKFRPGTRRISSAEIVLVEPGGIRSAIKLEPVLAFQMKGIGYTHAEWGHGVWKGELAIGGESWKESELDLSSFDNQHVQQVVLARLGDERGVGVLEQFILGRHARYGLGEFLEPPL